MDYRNVRREFWTKFFETVSKNVNGNSIEIKISGLDLGDQTEEDWSPIIGFSYETRSNGLYVHLASMDHFIPDPREVVVGENGALIETIGIADGEDRLQIINFRRPRLLSGQVLENKFAEVFP